MMRLRGAGAAPVATFAGGNQRRYMSGWDGGGGDGRDVALLSPQPGPAAFPFSPTAARAATTQPDVASDPAVVAFADVAASVAVRSHDDTPRDVRDGSAAPGTGKTLTTGSTTCSTAAEELLGSASRGQPSRRNLAAAASAARTEATTTAAVAEAAARAAEEEGRSRARFESLTAALALPTDAPTPADALTAELHAVVRTMSLLERFKMRQEYEAKLGDALAKLGDARAKLGDARAKLGDARAKAARARERAALVALIRDAVDARDRIDLIPPGTSVWDHSTAQSESVRLALLELRTVPSIDDHLKSGARFLFACEHVTIATTTATTTKASVTLPSILETGVIEFVMRHDRVRVVRETLSSLGLANKTVSELSSTVTDWVQFTRSLENAFRDPTPKDGEQNADWLEGAKKKVAEARREMRGFASVIQRLCATYTRLKGLTVGDLRSEVIHGALTFDTGIVLPERIRGAGHTALRDRLVDITLQQQTDQKERLPVRFLVSVPRNSKSALLQAIGMAAGNHTEPAKKPVKPFLITYNSQTPFMDEDAARGRLAARFFARIAASATNLQPETKHVGWFEPFTQTAEELEQLLVEGGAKPAGFRMFIAADEFSKVVQATAKVTASWIEKEFTAIMQLQTARSVVLFSGFGITDASDLAIRTSSRRPNVSFHVPMLDAADRRNDFADVLVVFALMTAQDRRKLDGDDAIAYEAAKTSAGILGLLLQTTLTHPIDERGPKLADAVGKAPWIEDILDREDIWSRKRRVVVDSLPDQFGPTNRRGVLPIATSATVKTLDNEGLLLVLPDSTKTNPSEACIAPLALWATRRNQWKTDPTFTPVPRRASIHAATSAVLTTFWWEYEDAVRQYHKLSRGLLGADEASKESARGAAGGAQGVVGEIVVRLAARLRVIGRNGSIIEARGNRSAKSAPVAAEHNAKKAKGSKSTPYGSMTTPQQQQGTSGEPLCIDSFPVPNTHTRKLQVLTALKVLVAETRATKEEQVLCVAVEGDNPAADESHVCATYDGKTGRVRLTMQLWEVKYGVSTKQTRSGKVKDTAKGLKEINAILAKHSRSDRAFPSSIESTTLTFVYLGPLGETTDEATAFAKEKEAARVKHGVVIKILALDPASSEIADADDFADAVGFLSPTLAALLIDEDALRIGNHERSQDGGGK